jgi:site-specific recombinase XerD
MAANTKTLTAFVQEFFTVALPQRGASPLTTLSYRDAMKLLLRFVAERKRRSVVKLDFADLDVEAVRAFLDHLESKRGNEIATRNNRLAAIRSFFTFVAAEEPSLADQCRRVCAIPIKRAPVKTVTYLENEEMQALLGAAAAAGDAGLRDHALLLFLYNTGARVKELVDIQAADLHLDRPRQVLLRGKRRKERIIPLWASTARALRNLLDEQRIALSSDHKVFLNAQGEPLTRFGVDYVLKKHVSAAAKTVPSLGRKRISAHTIRHTFAVHALNSGVDINTVRALLGHVDLRTTNIYAEINLATKRKAIEACAPSGPKGRRRRPSWKRKQDILEWLERL